MDNLPPRPPPALLYRSVAAPHGHCCVDVNWFIDQIIRFNWDLACPGGCTANTAEERECRCQFTIRVIREYMITNPAATAAQAARALFRD